MTMIVMNNLESDKGEIILCQPDETTRLEVRMGEDTVWLTLNMENNGNFPFLSFWT